MKKEDIDKREVRFAWHIPSTDHRSDLHYVREDITLKDGSIVPYTYLVKDYKRNVWVTRQSNRSHKEKKEFEFLENLNSRKTTQSDLNKTVAGLLGESYLVNQPDKIKNSPYVYGYDITSTSLIKYSSLKRNDFVQSKYSVAAFDIEVDPTTNEIIMATIAYNNKTHTAALSKFYKNTNNILARVKDAARIYIPNYEENYTKLDIQLTLHDNEVDLLKDVFRIANEWAPAFLCIWNMDYDISRIMECLKRHQVNPIDVICDQSVPRYARICRYKQGLKKKIKASGQVQPINPSLQWHTLITTSKFYVIDSMCVFRQLRMAQPERPSYSLDAILKSELETQKLKFDVADQYKGLKWHLFLQEKYPIEYTVYNLYDCLSMLELDEKTKDLSYTLPSFASITDFPKFNSQIRKISDALFLFGLERGRVLGTAGKPSDKKEEDLEAEEIPGDEEEDENDPSKYKTLDLKGWIQLLPQNLLLNEGLKCLEDFPEVITNLRGLTCDLDASSAYPSSIRIANVSKETCVNELISIENVPETVFREQNLSICLGNANMLEYVSVMFGIPGLDELTDMYL